MKAEEFCSEAAGLVSGDRQEAHGDANECHQKIADLWSAYLRKPLKPVDVAKMMVLLKLARSGSGKHNDDDYVDMIGYSALCGQMAGDK